MSYTALVFDFDGTIADTLTEGARIYNELAKEHGFLKVRREDLLELRSYETKDLLKHLNIPKRKIPLLITQGLQQLKRSIPKLSLIEGMLEVLPPLARHAEFFGILTSNSSENVEAFLDTHGIRDLFTFISCTSKLNGKAKHLRSIGRTFSLPPSKMLYIGDEIRDVRAARKAQIAAVGVTWGLNSRESLAAENPRYLADFPRELLKICGIPGPEGDQGT